MKQIETYGKISRGNIVIFDSATWIEQLREIFECNHCKITLEYGNKRSLDQNSYCWALCTKMAVRMRQDGVDVTKENIYRQMEAVHCTREEYNPVTKQYTEYIDPLKHQDTDRFAEILEITRAKFMQVYPDTKLEAPHEYYGISKQKYDKWKMGQITRSEAMKED